MRIAHEIGSVNRIHWLKTDDAWALALGVLGLVAGCSGGSSCPTSCAAGQVCYHGACAQVCGTGQASGCATGTECDPGSGLCLPITSAPQITKVSGSGDTQTQDSTNAVCDCLVVDGAHLAGATFSLTDSANQSVPLAPATTTVVGPDSDSHVELVLTQASLPAAGAYTLTAVNQVGSCSAPLTTLQGEQGTTGQSGSNATVPANLMAISSQLGTSGYSGANFNSSLTCVLGDILLSVNAYGGGGSFIPADGSLLAINTHTALFSILGTTFGGNGTTNFAIPDLRAFAPLGMQYSICIAGIFPPRN